MSPRPADPALHEAVVTAAARLLASGGRSALTTRRLAGEVGASTMAIYSRFGSLEEVHQAVRDRGFTELGAQIDAVPPTADPVADLTGGGLAYCTWALSHRELYRAMFTDRPAGQEDAGTGLFDRILRAVQRCVDAGRFEPIQPSLLPGWAAEVWVSHHGMTVLALAGLQPPDQIRLLLADMTYRLAVGYGDRADAARRSTEQALSEWVRADGPVPIGGQASSTTPSVSPGRRERSMPNSFDPR